MRILTVTHFYESHGGGIERVAGHLCRNLAALGHDCQWAASAADPVPADDVIGVLPLACVDPAERLTGLPMPIPGASGLRALYAAIGRADVLIVHDALYCTSIAAMAMARLRGTPVLLIQHIAAIPFTSAILRAIMALANRLVTRPMLARADQVAFISQMVRRAFATTRLKRPARTIFNGVDRAVFHAGAGDRSLFGLPAAGPVAAFVGRFVEKKGLAVIQALAARRPDIAFALAGTGPLDPAGWNLPNIHLLGTLAPAEVGHLFRLADVLLLPSVGEGYPLVVQEAMACGLPVICGMESAGADPAAACWLTGVTIDLADPAGTAARIADRLDLPTPAAVDRRAMAAYAAAAYDWPAMARAVAAMAAGITRRP